CCFHQKAPPAAQHHYSEPPWPPPSAQPQRLEAPATHSKIQHSAQHSIASSQNHPAQSVKKRQAQTSPLKPIAYYRHSLTRIKKKATSDRRGFGSFTDEK